MPISPCKKLQLIDEWGYFDKIEDDSIQPIPKYNQGFIFITELFE